MSTALPQAQSRSRFLPVLIIAAAAMLVAGVLFATQNAGAAALTAKPSDYGLKEGNTISASGSSDPDVYIINEHGAKRLFLNPVIFGFYGHLGGFSSVKSVTPATRDAFVTSGLYREVSDQKVYCVEVTGEDTGIFHWVNATGAQAVADDPDFFKKVFVINSNELNWYAKGSTYTSPNQCPDYSRATTSTAPTGPMSVSLAPGNPAGATVTLNAQGVEMLRVRLSGTGTVNSMTFKRGGAGTASDLTNVYVYDGATRLTSAKSLSTSTGEVTFVGLNVSVNGTRDLSFVADMSGTAGNVHNVALTSVAGSGSVSGTPVSGNNFTVSAATGGSITLAKTGSLSNPNVGAKNVKLSDFKLTANTEAASVKRISLFQGGTVKSSDLMNVKLMTGSNTWNGSVTSDGYLVFDLGSGFSIAKGGNATFEVWGDVNGRKDETVKLYFETATDILAVGGQYGFGMTATITALDTAAEAHSLTLQGGVLTLNFVGPTATNIGTDTTDTVFLTYSMSAASNIEIRKTQIVMCADVAGDGTFDTLATDFADVEDIKITNSDTGVVLVGPADGSAFTTAETTASCPDSKVGLYKLFTDVFDINAGQTLNLKITGDVKTANSGTVALSTSSVIRAVLEGYGTLTGSSGDLTVMKYAGTNTAVTSADISPSTDISGPNMTIRSSSLTLGLAGTPSSQTFVKGTTGVSATGITFAASQGSAAKVTNITLTGYVADSGATLTKGVGTGADANLSVSGLVSAVKLYEAESGNLISSSPSANNLNNSTGTIAFNNLNWTIPAGSTKTLLVKVDLSTNATSGSSDVFSFDIDATTDVTALDDNGNSINAGNSDPNGSTSPSVYQTVNSSGSLTASLAPSSPSTAGVYWGQDGYTFSTLRFTSSNEGAYIETLNLYTADTAANLTANVGKVILAYKNKAGQDMTAEGLFNTSGSVSFGFTGDSRPYVPKDSSLDISVKANMKTKSQGATNNVNFSIDFSGGNADEFRAIGEGSNAVIDGSASGIANVAGNNMYVYRVFPKFSKVADTATTLNPTDMEVLRFTVEAMGLSDSKLLFDNQATGSGSIKFEVVASGQGSNAVTFNVYDASDDSLVDASGSITAGTVSTPRASLTFDFTTKDIEIAGGQSKTFYIRADLNKFADNGDYFSVVLRDDEAGLVNWVANATGSTNDADTASSTGVLRQLPLFGTTKTRSI